MILALLFACAGSDKDSEAPAAAPTIEWLVPVADSTVPEGDLSCSLIVEYFHLEEPTMHNEGMAMGYLSLSLDGAEVLQTGETTPTVSVTAGEHTLSATLYYTDGDEVLIAGDVLCEEDDSEGCVTVDASVSFTVEPG